MYAYIQLSNRNLRSKTPMECSTVLTKAWGCCACVIVEFNQCYRVHYVLTQRVKLSQHTSLYLYSITLIKFQLHVQSSLDQGCWFFIQKVIILHGCALYIITFTFLKFKHPGQFRIVAVVIFLTHSWKYKYVSVHLI